jgi:hypothetical protein
LYRKRALGPLLFVAYFNDVFRNIESTVRVFTGDCIIYKEIVNKENIENLQKDLFRLRDWAAENRMKIN